MYAFSLSISIKVLLSIRNYITSFHLFLVITGWKKHHCFWIQYETKKNPWYFLIVNYFRMLELKGHSLRVRANEYKNKPTMQEGMAGKFTYVNTGTG